MFRDTAVPVDYASFSRRKTQLAWREYKGLVILSGTSRPQRGSEVESKDPENISSAMQIQGVLTRILIAALYSRLRIAELKPRLLQPPAPHHSRHFSSRPAHHPQSAETSSNNPAAPWVVERSRAIGDQPLVPAAPAR